MPGFRLIRNVVAPPPSRPDRLRLRINLAVVTSQGHIMKRISAIASVLAALVSTSALAKGEIPFEKVKGWDIERTGQTCLMTKAWKDKSYNNAQNASSSGWPRTR